MGAEDSASFIVLRFIIDCFSLLLLTIYGLIPDSRLIYMGAVANRSGGMMVVRFPFAPIDCVKALVFEISVCWSGGSKRVGIRQHLKI